MPTLRPPERMPTQSPSDIGLHGSIGSATACRRFERRRRHTSSFRSPCIAPLGCPTTSRSAARGGFDVQYTLVPAPLVGCSGVLASHFARRTSLVLLFGKITRSNERPAWHGV